MRRANRIVIGIDWGTHSSKWWYSLGTGRSAAAPADIPVVVDSTVYRIDDDLAVYRERARHAKEDVADRRLKRLLLGDPQGASYWDAVREGIGISLGKASVLTIGSLFGDALDQLVSEGYELGPDVELSVRFSLPNWIGDDPGHKAARRRMYETSVVSAALLDPTRIKELPKVGRRVAIQDWRDLMKSVRSHPAVLDCLKQAPKSFAEMVAKHFQLGPVMWVLAPESSAAGYLPLDELLQDVPRRAASQKHWVKLLVVDVGAGSTDSGYFVSSRTISDHELVMNYLPPARTLDFAGESLTEMLCDFYLRQGRELSIEEAEIMKINAPSRWAGQGFVRDWREKIAKSVADYIFHVPDDARLGEPAIPGLKIVLTGGSGAVLGLDNAIKEAVVDALARRGVPGNVAERTELVPFRTRFIPDRIDALRRAVSIGQGQPDFVMLAYRDAIAKSTRTVVASRGWV